MQIAVLNEAQLGEARVALMPESIRKLAALKTTVLVESGAGNEAGVADTDYLDAGAKIAQERAALLKPADILISINRPPAEDIIHLKRGAIILK